jgi:hypothetical protein
MKPHQERQIVLLVDLAIFFLAVSLVFAAYIMWGVRKLEREEHPVKTDYMVEPVLRYDSIEAVAPPAIADSARAKMLRRLVHDAH